MNLFYVLVLVAFHRVHSEDVRLNKNIANLLLDNSFKTLDSLEKTYTIVEKRLEKLDLFFNRCTKVSYRKSLDTTIKEMYERIDKKYDSENNFNPTHVNCIHDAKQQVSQLVRNSTQTLYDCMLKKETRFKDVKRQILTNIKNQEYKVQQNLCALMECKQDHCLLINSNNAATLLTQASVNSTELPIKGYHSYIDEYRLQFDQCKKSINDDLDKKFNETHEELHICSVGLDKRIIIKVKKA